MSLRRAKLDDHWRHATTQQSPSRLDSFSFERLPGLQDGTIHFRSGINAIVGGNGVGKSTLLAAIAELLTGEAIKDALGHSARLSGSQTRGVATRQGRVVNLEVIENAEGMREAQAQRFEGTTRWLEPSYLATQYRKQIEVDQNFEDNLEPLTPIHLSQEELEIASYVVGKVYSNCEIFEIADYAGIDRMPYFRVSSDGVTYGTEAMGQGELSLMLIYWTLRDLPKQSLLVLEEPETHVSPKSQSALMDIVAKFCDEKSLWIVVTTHSPAIITKLPRTGLRLVTRGVGNATIIDNPSNTQVGFLLGGGVAYRGAFLVEDSMAKSFLVAVLQELDPDLCSQFEICVAGSDSRISAALRAMPVTRHWLRIVGVYDGDSRDGLDSSDFNWPATFLPGAASPEELLIGALLQAEGAISALATELNRERQVIELAMNSAAGMDHHDWLFEMARVAGIEHEVLLRSLLRVWLQQAGNRAMAAEFCNQLRRMIDAD